LLDWYPEAPLQLVAVLNIPGDLLLAAGFLLMTTGLLSFVNAQSS
jgi:hypothetical protein